MTHLLPLNDPFKIVEGLAFNDVYTSVKRNSSQFQEKVLLANFDTIGPHIQKH